MICFCRRRSHSFRLIAKHCKVNVAKLSKSKHFLGFLRFRGLKNGTKKERKGKRFFFLLYTCRVLAQNTILGNFLAFHLLYVYSRGPSLYLLFRLVRIMYVGKRKRLCSWGKWILRIILAVILEKTVESPASKVYHTTGCFRDWHVTHLSGVTQRRA